MVTYALSLIFFTLWLALAAIPVAVSWEPVQLILGRSIAVVSAAFVAYAFIGLFHIWSLFSVFVVLFLCLDSLTAVSAKLWPSRSTSKQTFVDFHQRYLRVRILMKTLNNAVQVFLAIHISVGVSISSFSIFAALKLGKYLPALL